MKKLLCLVLLSVGCSGASPDKTQPEPQTPASTVVSISAGYDCETRATPTASAYMSDGSFQSVKLYPPTGDGSSVPCADGFIVNSLVDCNGTKVVYFCAPADFACTYFTSDGFSSQELCKAG